MKKVVLYSLSILSLFGLFSYSSHLLKLSTSKIWIQNEQLSYESRIFLDDLEASMNDYSRQPFHFVNGTITKDQKAIVERYFKECFSVKVNNVLTTVKNTSVEIELSSDVDNPIVVMKGVLESSVKASAISKMAVKNTMLFAYVYEQKNIVNILKIKKSDSVLMFENTKNMGYLPVKF
jgi:hypothetical protein